MRVDVKLDSNDTMLKRRGLNPSGRVQRLMTTECARQMDPYVPMRQGTGSAYAKSGEPKKYVSPPKDLQYHGAPKRGPYWDKRMWADKGKQITVKIAKAAGGTT